MNPAMVAGILGAIKGMGGKRTGAAGIQMPGGGDQGQQQSIGQALMPPGPVSMDNLMTPTTSLWSQLGGVRG